MVTYKVRAREAVTLVLSTKTMRRHGYMRGNLGLSTKIFPTGFQLLV
jgi:hypothetical protein